MLLKPLKPVFSILRCLDTVGEFQDLLFVFADILLILNLSATCKFVPFSLFSKCEIMVCLSFIEVIDWFHCVDMAVI